MKSDIYLIQKHMLAYIAYMFKTKIYTIQWYICNLYIAGKNFSGAFVHKICVYWILNLL